MIPRVRAELSMFPELTSREPKIGLEGPRKIRGVLIAGQHGHFHQRHLGFQQEFPRPRHPLAVEVAEHRSAKDLLISFLELEVIDTGMMRQLF